MVCHMPGRPKHQTFNTHFHLVNCCNILNISGMFMLSTRKHDYVVMAQKSCLTQTSYLWTCPVSSWTCSAHTGEGSWIHIL